MRNALAAVPRSSHTGVHVVTGYGTHVRVERGHLRLTGGVAGTRTEVRLTRVDRPRRVVVIGTAGSISLDALAWLKDVGAAFVHLDTDGELLTLGAPRELQDAQVRRGQALAPFTSAALDLGRTLLAAKLTGQAEVLVRRGGLLEHRRAIAVTQEALGRATTVDELRYVESRAAVAYWEALAEVPLHFPSREAKRVPAHWRTVGPRQSLLSSSPRKAVTPAHAVWNYCYSILEAEARIALLAVGCDPVLGILHADRQSRPSLAFDLMEPVRPAVDAFVLELLDAHTFTREDVFETREGVCRLLPPLAAYLAQTAPRWRRLVAPHAEWLATQFSAAADLTLVPAGARSAARPGALLRTPLTGANRRRAEVVRDTGTTLAAIATGDRPRRCRSCSTDLGSQRRRYCDTCLPQAVQEASRKGAAIQQQLRAVGDDRRSSPEVRARHRAHAAEQAALERAWEQSVAVIPVPRDYDEHIAPRLRTVPAVAIREVTGLSTAAAKAIRSGRLRPHPRHWDALRALAESLAADARETWRDLPDSVFARQIAPRLVRLASEQVAQVTGLSLSYCRRMRHGHHVPHRRHWPALLTLVGAQPAPRRPRPK